DAHLQGGPILDQRGHMGADLRLQGGYCTDLVLMDGHVHLHGIVDLVHMDDPIPQATGDLWIDQDHHRLGHLYGRQAHIHRHTKATVSMPVRGGYLYQGHLQGEDPSSEQEVDLTEENGNVVPAEAIDELADVVPHEHGVQGEAVPVGFPGVGRVAFGMDGYDLHIPEFPMARTEGIDQ